MLENVINLGSSSKGNSYFLRIKRETHEKSYGLLIECGFSYNELLFKLNENGLSLKDVDGVLVTHYHDDHSKALKELANMGKRIFAPLQAYKKYGINIPNLPLNNAHVIKDRKTFVLADKIIVKPFPLNHDHIENMSKSKNNNIILSDDYEKVEIYGFIITINNNFNILFIIDTMFLPFNISHIPFDVVFIESNYLEKVAHIALNNAKKTNDYGNQKRYERLIYSHMSVETAIKTINGLNLNNTKTIFLTHTTTSLMIDESRFYNIFKQGIKKKSNVDILVCKKNGGLYYGRI